MISQCITIIRFVSPQAISGDRLGIGSRFEELLF